MVMKSEKRSAAFKTGIFIIISFILLIFGILWLRHFAVSPATKIVAKFKDPGPVSSGMPVYYQGVNVGKVPKVGFSDDFKYTLIYIHIYNKELQLPDNITAMVRTEGITGQRYISMTYPEEPSNELLSSNDVIKGEKPFGIEDVQDFFEKNLKNGRMKKFMENIESAVANANKASMKVGFLSDRLNTIVAGNEKGINDFIAQSTGAAVSINELFGDSEIKRGVKSTMTRLDGFVERTDVNVNKIFEQIETSSLIPNMSYAFYETGSAFQETDNLLKEISSTDTNGNLVVETLKSTNQAAQRVDCFTKNMGETLSKNFLFFRLLFGRPGEPFEECENMKEYTKGSYPSNVCPQYNKPTTVPSGY